MKITNEMIDSIEFNEIGKDEDGNTVYELKADKRIMKELHSKAILRGLTLNDYIIDLLTEEIEKRKNLVDKL